MHAYSCDDCGVSSGLADPEKAWRFAQTCGWTRVEGPIDHTGHVPTAHYCPRHAQTVRALTFTS